MLLPTMTVLRPDHLRLSRDLFLIAAEKSPCDRQCRFTPQGPEGGALAPGPDFLWGPSP